MQRLWVRLGLSLQHLAPSLPIPSTPHPSDNLPSRGVRGCVSSTNTTSSRKPRVLLKVGNSGDVGTVEMQDLLLTTKGGTAGAVMIEWNVKAKSPGAAALWGQSQMIPLLNRMFTAWLLTICRRSRSHRRGHGYRPDTQRMSYAAGKPQERMPGRQYAHAHHQRSVWVL